MSINETIKSIHRLAVLRDDMTGREWTSIVITPVGSNAPESGEVADYSKSWEAQTYRGKGQWGTVHGIGEAPEEALNNLLSGLVDAHKALDERRAVALKSIAK
jgi:hypothetical protein